MISRNADRIYAPEPARLIMRKYLADVRIKAHPGHIKKALPVQLRRIDGLHFFMIKGFYRIWQCPSAASGTSPGRYPSHTE